jgi:hypothetical protein
VHFVVSSELLPGANLGRRPFWADCIFAFDRILQRRQGVFAYSHKPDCIFLAQVSRLSGDVLLSDGTSGRPGDRVIDLHLWNEHIAAAPVEGRSLAAGLRVNRDVAKSLHELAQFLSRKPELSDVNIIRANINLDLFRHIAARQGFEAESASVKISAGERLHQFGENILFWFLALACNFGRALPKEFWRHRQVMYLSRKLLDRKERILRE